MTNAQDELEKVQLALARAQQKQDRQEIVLSRTPNPANPRPRIEEHIVREEQIIADNQGYIEALGASGLKLAEQEHNRTIYTQLIERAAARIAEHEKRQGELASAVADATVLKAHYTKIIKDIQGYKPGAAAPKKPTGELASARTARAKARTDKDTATYAVTEGQKGLTPEKQVQVNALEQWKKVGENYGAIVTERFRKHDRGDRLRGAALGSTADIDGEIQGAARIREHIFDITDPKWWTNEENRELAKRMLSDEAIAKGVIDAFSIDTGRMKIADPAPGAAAGATISVEQCFTQIEGKRKTLDDALDKLAKAKAEGKKDKALDSFKKNVKDARDDIQAYEKPLLQAVLPYVQQANEFQRGTLMDGLVRQALDAAGQGQAFWNGLKGKEFIKPQAELTATAEAILDEHKGVATFAETNMEGYGEAPRVVWEGELGKVQAAAFGFVVLDPTAELTFKITNDLDREEASATVDVLINEEFLKTLPLNLVPGTAVADEIRELFYDTSITPPGLRSEIRARDRAGIERLLRERGRRIDNRGNMWLSVMTGSLQANTSDDLLDRIDTSVSPDAGRAIAVATANTILAMTPDERLEKVKALQEVFVSGFQLLEAPGTVLDLAIQYDNDGVLWIQKNAGGSRQPLEAFYTDRERAYREFLGVQNLNPSQRAALQDQFRIIQEELGRRVIEVEMLR